MHSTSRILKPLSRFSYSASMNSRRSRSCSDHGWARRGSFVVRTRPGGLAHDFSSPQFIPMIVAEPLCHRLRRTEGNNDAGSVLWED
jgi:hypothetical protein